MTIIRALTISLLAAAALAPAAGAAPVKLPVVTPVASSVHLASIRHNRIRLMVRLPRGNF
jgi:hypothetical protein